MDDERSGRDPAAGEVHEGSGDIGQWSDAWRPGPELEAAFASLVGTLRRVQDAVTGARPTVDAARKADALLASVADLLDQYEVEEHDQLAGKQSHLPGRAQSLVPTVYMDHADADRAGGRVTFTRFYLGGGGAAHGGSLPLVFDELLGRLAGFGGRPRSRTAYLRVDYRAVTPLDRPLQLEGVVERVEGRKIFTTATLRDGATLVAEADALFLILKEGQP